VEWWCQQKKTDTSSMALWQFFQQINLVKSKRDGKIDEKYFCSYLQVIFTCLKILRHEALGFTSSPKEGVLRILIALKSLSPQPGLNTRTLSPSIIPPRMTWGGTSKILIYLALDSSLWISVFVHYILLTSWFCSQDLWRDLCKCVTDGFHIIHMHLPHLFVIETTGYYRAL
jgi:hypothetical protein